jgi:3-phosphoshikimate 1-carboxyvinyltransferase
MPAPCAHGDGTPPKSVAHRALILRCPRPQDGVVEKRSRPRGYRGHPRSALPDGGNACTVGGRVLVGRSSPTAGPVTVDCAESGSTLRFLIPVAPHSARRHLYRSGRLPERPLGPYLDLFRENNLLFELTDCRLPCASTGSSRAGCFSCRGRQHRSSSPADACRLPSCKTRYASAYHPAWLGALP